MDGWNKIILNVLKILQALPKESFLSILLLCTDKKPHANLQTSNIFMMSILICYIV